MILDPALSWYALRTASGRELLVWQELSWADMAGFVPRAWRTVRIVGGRKGKIPRLYPLIPGYAFVGLAAAERLAHALGIDGVLGVLRVDGEPARLCPRSLKQLQDMRPLDPIARFRKGDLVTIVDGPLAGRRVRLRDFVAGKAQIEIAGHLPATIPLASLEAA